MRALAVMAGFGAAGVASVAAGIPRGDVYAVVAGALVGVACGARALVMADAVFSRPSSRSLRGAGKVRGGDGAA